MLSVNRGSFLLSLYSSCFVFGVFVFVFCLIALFRTSVVRVDHIIPILKSLKWIFLELGKKSKVLAITHMFWPLSALSNLMAPMSTLVGLVFGIWKETCHLLLQGLSLDFSSNSWDACHFLPSSVMLRYTVPGQLMSSCPHCHVPRLTPCLFSIEHVL